MTKPVYVSVISNLDHKIIAIIRGAKPADVVKIAFFELLSTKSILADSLEKGMNFFETVNR